MSRLVSSLSIFWGRPTPPTYRIHGSFPERVETLESRLLAHWARWHTRGRLRALFPPFPTPVHTSLLVGLAFNCRPVRCLAAWRCGQGLGSGDPGRCPGWDKVRCVHAPCPRQETDEALLGPLMLSHSLFWGLRFLLVATVAVRA